MSTHRRDVSSPLTLIEGQPSRAEIASAEGEARFNSLDLRLQAARSLTAVAKNLCEQSPNQLLSGAFRSALANVMAEFKLPEKDRGLLIRLVRRHNMLGPQFASALGLDDDMKPKGTPARARDATPTILTGVSGGALVASALVCGISPERSVEAILEVAGKTRQQLLNIYHPGYSLIDVVEQNLLTLLNTTMDADHFQERLKGGRLRIGLTDGRVFPPLGHNPEAYRYIDSFQSVEEIVAACVLSSYVPGATGPLLSSSVTNPAVRRSQDTLTNLAKRGVVKDFYGHSIEDSANRTPPVFMDGGLVNVWPVIDDETLIVTPLTAHFPTHDYICPTCTDSNFVNVNHYSSLAMDFSNMSTMQDIIWFPVDDVLEQRFAQGHDNARHFLERKNLLSPMTV